MDEGQVETVKILLSRGANPNRGTDLSGTALHQAAQEGQQEIVDVLLSHGATIDATNSEGARATALQLSLTILQEKRRCTVHLVASKRRQRCS